MVVLVAVVMAIVVLCHCLEIYAGITKVSEFVKQGV